MCVLQVPEFNVARVLGGAEVVAVQLVQALADVARVTVLHGYWEAPSPEPARTLAGTTVRMLAAFPIDSHVREHGHVRPNFNELARKALAEADVLVTVERTLNYPTTAVRIALLGGVGYPHSLEVLNRGAWDRLVVPSDFVAEQIVAGSPGVHGVRVIENGIDMSLFSPRERNSSSRGRLRLLVASRPVWDKGFRHAGDLVRALEHVGISVGLACFLQPDGFGPGDFADRLRQETGVCADTRPWQPHHLMPDFYRGADLTLCLGDALEGFGFAAAESVACGTPVLAHPVGFLAHMFPPDHGVFLVPSGVDAGDWVVTAKRALVLGRGQCINKGRPYALRRYAVDRMAREFVQLVGEMGEAR